MINKYKIRCKLCGDILEENIPLKGEVKCSCGNIGIYSEYIAFGMVKNLPKEECYESLKEESLTIEEVKKYLNQVEQKLETSNDE